MAGGKKMFDLLKSIIWIIGILVIAYFIMGYFGYEINLDYFTYSKKECQGKVSECANSLVRKGIDNAQCDFMCVDPDLIIKKKK